MFLSSKRLFFKQIILLTTIGLLPQRMYAKSSLWHTLAWVQRDLFPDRKGVPTLQSIRAGVYLRHVMHDVRITQEEKDFIRNGERWLNETSQEQYQKNYTALKDSQRQKVLHVISQEPWGERWIKTVLTYIMEALLCDPVYGGNVAEVGWRWLQHTPGLPRPKKAQV